MKATVRLLANTAASLVVTAMETCSEDQFLPLNACYLVFVLQFKAGFQYEPLD